MVMGVIYDNELKINSFFKRKIEFKRMKLKGKGFYNSLIF